MAYPTRSQQSLFSIQSESAFARDVYDLLDTWTHEMPGRDINRLAMSIHDYVAVVNRDRVMTMGDYLKKVAPVGAPDFFNVARNQLVDQWRGDVVQFATRIKQMFGALFILNSIKRQAYITSEPPLLSSAVTLASLTFHYQRILGSVPPSFDPMLKFKQYVDKWNNDYVERMLKQYGKLTVADTDDDSSESLADATSAENKGRPLPANTILTTTTVSPDDQSEEVQQVEAFLNPAKELFRVFDSVRLLLITFRESYKNCEDQVRDDTPTLAFAGLSDPWIGEVLDEFNQLEKRVEKLNKTGILTPPIVGESAEHYLKRVSQQLSDSKLVNIENRLQRMVEEVRLKCPPKERGWFVPPFSPEIKFNFARDSIPDDMNRWLVVPLKGKQNPKAVLEVILNNGGGCPAVALGQTLLDGWQVKKISRVNTNPYWKTSELLAKKAASDKIDEVFTDPIASMNSLWKDAGRLGDPVDFVKAKISEGMTPSAVWSLVQQIVGAKDAFEPLMAQYMQQVSRCGLFLGIQKPSDDDDDEKAQEGGASAERGSTGSILSDLTRDLIDIGSATLSMARGENVVANMARIATAFASITYTLTVRALIQTGLGGAFRSLISHPFIGGSLILMGVSAASVSLPLMMGYAAGTTVLPVGTGFWTYLTSSIFSKIAEDIGTSQFGLSPYNLSSIFTTWGSMINLLRAIVCGDSLYSKLAQTAIKYYTGRLFLRMLAKSTSGGGGTVAALAKMANWWEACFGTILQQVISMICAGNLNSLLWIWDATSNLRNSVTGFYKSLPNVFPRLGGGTAEGYGTATTGITSVIVTGRNNQDLYFQTMDGETYKTSSSSFSQLARYTTGRPGQQQQYESQLDGYLKNTNGFRVDAPQRHALIRSIDIAPTSDLPAKPSLFESLGGGQISGNVTQVSVDRNITAFATDAFKNSSASPPIRMPISVASATEISTFTRPSFPKVSEIRSTLSGVSTASADVINSASFDRLGSILNNSGEPMVERMKQADVLLASNPRLGAVINASVDTLESRGFGDTIKGPLMFVAQMAVFMAAATVGATGLPADVSAAGPVFETGIQVLAQSVNF